jgi:outer membrane protein assembly factor BamB
MKNLLSFTAVLGIACSATADTLWRQYGFDAAHTSYNKSEAILNPSNVGSLSLLWTSPSFQVSGFVPSVPTLGFEAIFFNADGRIHALEKQTGQQRWGRLSCSGVGTVQPAFGHGIVIIGDAGGDLAGYDPATGNQVWCHDEGGSIVSAPAVADDTVFITNSKDAVALDQFTGREHWRFSGLDRFGIHLTSTPAIANGVVFVTGDGWVFALDGITGRKIWGQQLQAPKFRISSAAVANFVVYVGGQEALYALSAFDGHLIWQNTLVSVVPTPAIAEGRVFVNSEDPNFGLWAFDAATGGFLWRRQRPGEPATTVTVANGVVYDIDDSGTLQMFDAARGTFLASIRDPDGKPFVDAFGSQPIVANGTIYVSAGDRVDAFHLSP